MLIFNRHKDVHPLLTYVSDFNVASTKHFERSLSITGKPYWSIPADFSIRLESADLVFTTLVAKQVIGEGKKLYHHEELPQKDARIVSAVNRRGWICADDDDDDNEGPAYEYDYDTDGW